MKIAFIKVSSHPKEFSHTKDGIELTGTLTRTRGHKVELNAHMRGEIILDCDRCAKKYPYRIDTPLEFALYDKVFPLENEEDLDTVTLLSGCGPAIVSQFVEILANYGVDKGLSLEKSRTLALQTFKGTVG
ncbi:MAG: hypothetical protein IE878_07075, partial [Epsilonproteobacteria bacterium]|nr:hypothetical protein [Campylobacterota bacterium]